MRAFHVGSMPFVISLAALLAGCAGGAMSPEGPFAPPPPPVPGLFVSPFGETFTAEVGQPWPVADWFLGADENLDGVLTLEEFSADGRRWFARLDTDRDGRLNQAELLAYEQSLRDVGSGIRAAGPGAPPPQARAGSRMGRNPGRAGPPRYGIVAEAGFFNLPQPVKSADVNIDQRVTPEEWANATQRWFLSLDGDRDGKLTLATLPKTPLQARAERRGPAGRP